MTWTIYTSCLALINGAVDILFFLVQMASVASGQRLVLAVVNSSDWDTDDHTQSCNGLDKKIRKMKKLYNSMWGIIIHDSYIPFRRTYQQSWHSRKTAAMIRAPCSTTKATMTWATNCFMGLRNFIPVIRAGCPGGLPFERSRDALKAPNENWSPM